MAQTLTDREADVMKVLWEHGPSGVAEVRAHLADPLARNTVLTMLRILEEKGFVKHKTEGRSHRYFALVPEQVARQHAVKHLIGKLFRGSTDLLFAHLVTTEALTAADVARIKAKIDQPRSGKGRRS